MGRRPASQIRAEQVETLTAAGGALVRLASESLAEVDARVSLIQLRALIALSEFGTMRAVDLAARLAVSDSSVTRLCDRLVADGLIRRELNPVSLSQFRALLALSEFGTMRATDLRVRIGASTASVTRLCNRLVAEGLIRREVNPDNRREVHLTATPDGRRLVHRIVDRRRQDVRRVLAGPEEAERDAASAALSRFTTRAAGLQQADAHAAIDPLRKFAYLAAD